MGNVSELRQASGRAGQQVTSLYPILVCNGPRCNAFDGPIFRMMVHIIAPQTLRREKGKEEMKTTKFGAQNSFPNLSVYTQILKHKSISYAICLYHIDPNANLNSVHTREHRKLKGIACTTGKGKKIK